jgi:translation initiation factor IF-1
MPAKGHTHTKRHNKNVVIQKKTHILEKNQLIALVDSALGNKQFKIKLLEDNIDAKGQISGNGNKFKKSKQIVKEGDIVAVELTDLYKGQTYYEIIHIYSESQEKLIKLGILKINNNNNNKIVSKIIEEEDEEEEVVNNDIHDRGFDFDDI